MSFKLNTLLVLWASWVGMGVSSQPAACYENSNCPSGFYCEKATTRCLECLQCEVFKRKPPPGDVCVTSVVHCGGCTEGLVEDLRMDNACVPALSAPTAGADAAVPAYMWAVVGLLLAVLVVLIVYVAVNRETLFQFILKIRATTSVHSTAAAASPSAPEPPPPPYTALYAPAQPPRSELFVVDEEADLLLKRTQAPPRPREAADCQAARPYSNPNYIRGPTSYNQNEEAGPASPPFTPQDEDTMESPWTPNETTNNVVSDSNGNAAALANMAGAAGPAAGARAADSDDEGPPAKTLCVREDSNNNRGRESGAGAAPALGPVVHISVVSNFTSLEQRNNVNLPGH
ncbi:uncharacterized protein LOC135073279 isoform X1 [Ostrinia nubilalis]|uniref:uncharacterized protein LOC135073279 isoform X1 n=2 Tax=Ostrinia nubilalis TaxID=29057 RepID=UPI00308254AE